MYQALIFFPLKPKKQKKESEPKKQKKKNSSDLRLSSRLHGFLTLLDLFVWIN